MAPPDDPHDPQEQRLDELQEGIDAARKQAEEHGTIPTSTPEQTFIDPDADDRESDDDEHPGEVMGF